MRELEFLASLRRLRAIESGGWLDETRRRALAKGRVICVIDPANGFTHWISSTPIPNYEDD